MISNVLFFPSSFLSLLFSYENIKVSFHLYFCFFCCYLLCVFLLIFSGCILHYLISFIFYSKFDRCIFIIFLIELCFYFYPSIFIFKLFLYQIYSSRSFDCYFFCYEAFLLCLFSNFIRQYFVDLESLFVVFFRFVFC